MLLLFSSVMIIMMIIIPESRLPPVFPILLKSSIGNAVMRAEPKVLVLDLLFEAASPEEINSRLL